MGEYEDSKQRQEDALAKKLAEKRAKLAEQKAEAARQVGHSADPMRIASMIATAAERTGSSRTAPPPPQKNTDGKKAGQAR